MIVCDTSFLIAFLEPSDFHHATAVAILTAHSTEQLVIHPINLAELFVGARSDAEADSLADFLAQNLRLEILTLEASHARQLGRMRRETGLKLPDCCAVVAAAQRSASVVTFDERQAKVARDLGLTVLTDAD
ncbi:MAG: PIN domain-containing protein [Propionibacteriaceae bacterium]|nr:PIN domain-containing protein [Propionibacteriaceae bacterium]